MSGEKQGGAEHLIENVLFKARWIMAPMYVGLIFALVLLVINFASELIYYMPKALSMETETAILVALKLIDLTFAASLVLIVIFSGYENFISRLDTIPEGQRPTWMGKVDFSGLKMKLIASVVAISSIHLLKVFMELGSGDADTEYVYLLAFIHIVFITSGVMMAIMDYLNSLSKKNNKETG